MFLPNWGWEEGGVPHQPPPPHSPWAEGYRRRKSNLHVDIVLFKINKLSQILEARNRFLPVV